MKKIIAALVILLFANTAFAYNYTKPVTNDVKDTQSLKYNIKTKEWTKVQDTKNETVQTPPNEINNDEIIFTKYVTKGSGGYSVYENNQKQYDAGSGTTYEFLDGTSLIGYNAHNLKFYRLDFDGEKITGKELTIPEIKQYFPDVQIVKISKFKNNKIELKKKWFKPETFMLVNDTNTDFYKYQFEEIKTYQLIHGMFEIEKSKIKPQRLIYSHFGSRDKMFPILKIKVRNSF